MSRKSKKLEVHKSGSPKSWKYKNPEVQKAGSPKSRKSKRMEVPLRRKSKKPKVQKAESPKSWKFTSVSHFELASFFYNPLIAEPQFHLGLYFFSIQLSSLLGIGFVLKLFVLIETVLTESQSSRQNCCRKMLQIFTFPFPF